MSNGRWRSEGNSLDIPQCWPMPFRASARVSKKPRDTSRKSPAERGAGPGCRSRKASAAVAGFIPHRVWLRPVVLSLDCKLRA